MSARLASYFRDYSGYHRAHGNRVCHYFGIPFIVISLLGLLSQFVILSSSDLFRVDGGILLIATAMLWYLVIDWKISLPFGLVLLGTYFLARTLPVPVHWILFITGWVIQYLGHGIFEKNSPAFYKNFEHILIGPLWIFAKLIKY